MPHRWWAAVLVLLLCAAPLPAREPPALRIPAHGVVGVEEVHLDPEFWVARLREAHRPRFDRAGVAAHNARLMQRDRSLFDLRALPATLSRGRVHEWISALSRRPQKPLFAIDGSPIPATRLDALDKALALDAIPATQPPRYGLVVQRAERPVHRAVGGPHLFAIGSDHPNPACAVERGKCWQPSRRSSP